MVCFLMDEQFSSFFIFCKSKETEQCNISTSPKTQTDSLRPNSTEDNRQTCQDNSTCPTADRRRGTMLSEIPVGIQFNPKLIFNINYMITLLILPFCRISDSTTWFGSSVPLNRTQILQDINPKTAAEYEQIRQFNEDRTLDKKNKYPHYSEYTDRFTAHSKVVPILTT